MIVLKFIAKVFYGVELFPKTSEELEIDSTIEEQKLFWINLENSRVAPKYGINKK